jgi:hypothetical protein
MLNYTNLNNVYFITVYNESENLYWECLKPLKERKIFFGLITITKERPEGWFPKRDWENSKVHTLEEVIKKENNSVYFNGVKLMNKSYIYVKCKDGSFEKYFDTYEAACEYTNEMAKHNPNLVKFE